MSKKMFKKSIFNRGSILVEFVNSVYRSYGLLGS